MLEHNEFILHLVRHGQSETNANPDLMGQTDTVPLTELGKKQAQCLHDLWMAEFRAFDYAFSSPYTRAHDTAKIALASSALPIKLDTELREYDAGEWTGCSRKDTLTKEVRLRMNYMDHGFLPPEGESLHQVERRAGKWLEDNILYNKDMIQLADWKRENKHPILNIAVFSHGMTIKCMLHYIMGFDKSLTWKVTIDNTSVSSLHFGKEGWRVLSINDCSHLRPWR